MMMMMIIIIIMGVILRRLIRSNTRVFMIYLIYCSAFLPLLKKLMDISDTNNSVPTANVAEGIKTHTDKPQIDYSCI